MLTFESEALAAGIFVAKSKTGNGASQFEPDYEKLLEMQSQFHSSHSPS
jgi:hypothetical protein